jgi:hypothetical protein
MQQRGHYARSQRPRHAPRGAVEIARRADHVWEFVADSQKDPTWCPKLKGVEAAGAGRWWVTRAVGRRWS